MDMTLLANARTTLAKVKTLEMMIADIDGLYAGGLARVQQRGNGCHADPAFHAAQSLDKLRQQLDIKKEQAALAYRMAVEALDNISDDETRQILFLRHIKKCTWEQIASHFGPGYTSSALKQKHSRYLRSQRIPPAASSA